MSITQAMESLVEGIRATTAARNAFLSNLDQSVEKHQQQVRHHMKSLQREGQKKARELKTTLASLRRQLAEGEKNRQHTARQEAEQRRIAQSELHAHMHSFLKRAHLERTGISTTLRTHIASELSNIKNTVSTLRKAAQGMLGEIATDMRGTHQAWAGVKKSL